MSEFAGSAYSQVVTYTGLDLEIKGQTALTAFGLNNRDQVVGFTFSADYNGNPKAGTELPFVYTPGGSGSGFTTIPGLTASSSSAATGINNAGVIVGNDGNTGQGFVYTPSSSTLTEVSPLAGSSLTFSGVNNNGVAVGASSTSNGGTTVITYNISSGHTTDVGTGFTGSANSSYASAINDSGTILGLGTSISASGSYPAHFQPFTATPSGSTYSYTNVGNAVEAAIPTGASNAGYFLMQGLSAGGDVAGTVGGASNGVYQPYLSSPTGYLYNGSSGAVTNFGDVQEASAVADVNGSPEVVGSGYAYNPATLGHEYDAFTYTASGGMVDIAHVVPGYYLSNAIAINSNGDILATGYPSGSNSLRYVLLTANVTPSVTYTGAVSNSFDTTTANFTPTKYANGDFVTFDDSATGSTTVNIPTSVAPGSLVFNNSSKSYVLGGASVTGGSSTTLNINGGGAVTLNNVNTYTGLTNISSGSLTIGSTGSLASNNITLLRNGSMTILSGGALTSTALNLSLGNGSHFVVAATTPDKVVLQLASLTDYGVPLDLNNTDMILHNYAYGVSGSTSLIASGYAGGTWSGNGIVSTSAKNDPTHLTTLGTIQNSQDGTPTGTKLYSTFDGIPVVSSDVLVKYTYYGDANLDGHVDGSDYTLIDAAYNANQSGDSLPVTGWYNGDFNYDGVIDGSDYTLIDNAFNLQGAAFTGSSASVLATSEIANGGGAAVPEPATLALISVGSIGLLRRRQR
jgi:hypothetical protein